MKIQKSHIFFLAIIYLYSPMLIFLAIWTNLAVSIPVGALSIFVIVRGFRMLRANPSTILIDYKEIICSIVLIFLLLVFAGGGGLFEQDYDYSKHNSIVHDLVKYGWPVVYPDDSMLTYYLGQYIVPGFVGHVCGGSVTVGFWTQVVWNAIGLLIAFYLICYAVHADTMRKRAVTALVVLLFGGAILLGSFVYYAINGVFYSAFKWLDMYRVQVHFASNFNQIRGAFQHIIVPWIACGIFITDDNYEKTDIYMLLLLPLLFSATFGFVYFAFIMLSVWIVQCVKKGFIQEMKRAFSINNIALLPLFIVLMIYLSGNFMAEKPGSVGLTFINQFKTMDFYIIFVVSEFLLYFAAIYPSQKKNPIYYIILIQLMLIPWMKIGMFNDLCSRGANPARFILMIYCIQQLLQRDWKWIWNKVLITVLLISAVNVSFEFHEIITNSYANSFNPEVLTASKFETFEGMAGNPDIRLDEAYNYFTFDYPSSLFKKISSD